MTEQQFPRFIPVNSLGFDSVDFLFGKNSDLRTDTGSIRTVTTTEATSFNGFYFDIADNLWINKSVTNGTIAVNNDCRSLRLTIDNQANSIVHRQTQRNFVYSAGNSHTLTYGFRWNLQNNAHIEYGIGDADNSLAFHVHKMNGQYTIFAKKVSSASGQKVELDIPQSQWNIDKLDGTGASGLTLDLTKGQMCSLRWTWYGYGSVYFGIKIGGEVINVHRFDGGNNLSEPILGEPNLPIFVKIYNDGATGGSSWVEQSGIHLGIDGTDPSQRDGFYRSTPLFNDKNVTNGNTYVLASLRPNITFKSRNNRGWLKLNQFWIAGTSNGTYGIVYNPTLTGANWQNVDTNNSFCSYDISATAYTGGILLWTGGLTSNRGGDSTTIPDFKDPLSPYSDFSNTNHISLVYKCTANGTVNCGFNWSEYY